MGFRATGRDYLFFSGLLFGALSLTLTCVLPLRQSLGNEADQFPSRQMTLMGQTGRDTAMQDYDHWERLTCESYKIAATALFRKDSAQMAEQLAEESIPGVPQPCTTLHACRDHTAVRCYWYTALVELKGRVITYHVVGMVFYLFAIIGVRAQVNLKIATMMAMIGGLIQLGGCLLWAYVTDSMMNAIRTQVFWPYADLTGGFKGACALSGIVMLIALSGVTLAETSGKGEAPPEPEEEELIEGEEEEE